MHSELKLTFTLDDWAVGKRMAWEYLVCELPQQYGYKSSRTHAYSQAWDRSFQRNVTFQLPLHLAILFNCWGESKPFTKRINRIQILSQKLIIYLQLFQIICTNTELAAKLETDTLEDLKMIHRIGYANVEAHNAIILLLMHMIQLGGVTGAAEMAEVMHIINLIIALLTKHGMTSRS